MVVVGDHVRVVGLKSKPALNGATGYVKESSGVRWLVVFDPPHTGTVLVRDLASVALKHGIF
jgi:hypothetical protein